MYLLDNPVCNDLEYHNDDKCNDPKRRRCDPRRPVVCGVEPEMSVVAAAAAAVVVMDMWIGWPCETRLPKISYRHRRDREHKIGGACKRYCPC